MAGDNTAAAKKKPCGCGGKPVLQAKIIVKSGSKSSSGKSASNYYKKKPWYTRFLDRLKALF
ncbi:hypothetical protein [Metabacillus sp. 84]|uniref:hypothetical protein n=1 Tax=unclassified Metabacillus TaxID=2675274 RepID=UPI003CEDAE6E